MLSCNNTSGKEEENNKINDETTTPRKANVANNTMKKPTALPIPLKISEMISPAVEPIF